MATEILKVRRSFCGFLDAKPCLNFSSLVFRCVFSWSFSMLSPLQFLRVVSVDQEGSNLHRFDGVFCLD